MIYSFAFAFYILLSPKDPYFLNERTVNADFNNPWNLVPTYQQFDNETGNSFNSFIIQRPDDNTIMFARLTTASFATFLLFTGKICSFQVINNLIGLNHFSIKFIINRLYGRIIQLVI